MQIKTKRGPRRIRNQRVRDHRYAVTDYRGCSYVTAGKLYKLFKGRWDSVLSVMDDDHDEITCVLGNVSVHLNCTGTFQHPIH